MKPSGHEMNRSGVTLKVKRSRNANRQRKEPVVLAKVIFRMDDLVYFAILRGEIFLSCLRRLFFLSFFFLFFFPGTRLPWTFIRQTFAHISHPLFLFVRPFFFIRNKPRYIYCQENGENSTEDLNLVLRAFVCLPFSFLDTWACLSKGEDMFKQGDR